MTPTRSVSEGEQHPSLTLRVGVRTTPFVRRIRVSEPTVIIIGASVRAAAASAYRAGLRPWCADLFADRDLQRLGPMRRITRYPDEFREVLREAPPKVPLIYTGGLENYPRLLAGYKGPLWGNDSFVLRQI